MKLFSLFVLLTLSTGIFAQVGINATGIAPDASSGLDINFSDKGLLIPRLNTAQRNAIANPAQGLMIMNTDNDCLESWLGNYWKQSCFGCPFGTPIASNNGPICEGSTLNLSASTIAGAIYSWTGPNGFTSNVQNPTIPATTVADNGTYYVTASVNGCTSAAAATLASVNAMPTTPVAGSNSPVCQGDTLMLTVAPIAGATFSWTGPNGFSASGQSPIVTNFNPAAEGTYSVSANIQGCISPISTTGVTGTTICSPMIYSYTGTPEIFVVPANVTAINIDAYGAQGGRGYVSISSTQGIGGKGGRVQATLNVTPGETLYIYVGSAGGNTSGGWNGGGSGGTIVYCCGNGTYYGSGGGGASDIRRGGTTFSDRILVAGGGGGGGFSSPGGYGGDLNAGNGVFGGSGGTQSSGGSTGGSFGTGGNTAPNAAGGGGGAGWYGGGVDSNGAGGGGSSYVTINSSNVIHTGGAKTGDGEITITW